MPTSSDSPATAPASSAKDPIKTSADVRNRVNDLLKFGVGVDKITVDFNAEDSPFLKQLTAFGDSIKKKGWDAISITQPGAPGPAKSLQDLAMEVVEKHLTKLCEDIHAEAKRGEVFDPAKWKKKAEAIETAISNYIENKANFIGTPSTALAGIHTQLNAALEETKAQFNDVVSAPDPTLATQLQQATIEQTNAQSAFKKANDIQAQREALEEQSRATLDAIEKLVMGEKTEREKTPDLAGIGEQKYRLQQYGREPGYADELNDRIVAAKAEQETKWDAVTAVGVSYPSLDAAESALKAFDAALTAAEQVKTEADKLVQAATVKLTELGKKCDEAQAAVDAVRADPARAAELPKLEKILLTAQEANNKQNDHKAVLEGQLRAAEVDFNAKESAYENLKLPLNEYKLAHAAHDNLIREQQAIQPVVAEQLKLQKLTGSIPAELSPAFETMQQIKQQLSEVRASPAFELVPDPADPLKKVFFDPGTAKALLEAASEAAAKIFRQEFVQFNNLKLLSPQATLSEQITQATTVVNPQIVDQLNKVLAADKGHTRFPTLEQDLKNITGTPEQQFASLMKLANSTQALSDQKDIKNLAVFIEKAQAMQDNSLSLTPKPSGDETFKTLVLHLEQLQALSQQQFSKQSRYCAGQLETSMQEQHALSKAAQGKQVTGQQTLQTNFEKQAQTYIDALTTKSQDNALPAGEKDKIDAQITKLKDLLEQSKDAGTKLSQAGGKSADLIQAVQEQTKKMLNETAADHFAFMERHLDRQRMGLRTAQIREQWGWGKKSHQYYAISADQTLETQGRQEFGLSGRTDKAVQYEPGFVYKRKDEDGKDSDEEVGFIKNADGSFTARTVGVDYFDALGCFKVGAYKDATRAELDFLLAAGMETINVMPSSVNAFTPGNLLDQDRLFQFITHKLDVLAEKQVSLFTADKLPKEGPELDKFKNSYIITDVGKSWKNPLGGGKELHYIDDAGKSHKVEMTPSRMKAWLKDAGILGGVFSGADSEKAKDKGIKGVKRVILNDTAQIGILKSLVMSDPNFPKDPNTGGMIMQPAFNIDKQAHRKAISKLLMDGNITKSQAAKLFSQVNNLADTPVNKKDLVDTNTQAPAPASNQDADKGQLHGVSPGASISIDLTQQGQNILTNLGGGPGNAQVLSDDSGLPDLSGQVLNDASAVNNGDPAFLSTIEEGDEQEEEEEVGLGLEESEITVGLQIPDLDAVAKEKGIELGGDLSALESVLGNAGVGVDKQLQAITLRLEGMTQDDLIDHVNAGDIQKMIEKLVTIIEKQDKEDVINQSVLPAVVLAIALSEKKFEALEGNKSGKKEAEINAHRTDQETILKAAGDLIEKSAEKIVDKGNGNQAFQNFKAAANSLRGKVNDENTDVMVKENATAEKFTRQVDDNVSSKASLTL